MTTMNAEHKTDSIDTERQLVAFHLGDEIYGVDIAYIHTIITPQAITYVPRAPKFVKGVMNLRGRVLPVIDLRLRFGLGPIPEEKKKSSRIVIVDVEGLTAGLVVDSVTEVLRIKTEEIDNPSQLVTSIETECITGIGRLPIIGRDGKSGERLIILLDVYKILSTCSQDANSIKMLQHAA